MATTTQLLETMRYTYAPGRVRKLMNLSVPTYRILDKRRSPVGGRGQWMVPILNKLPGAWSGITEGGTVPTAIDPDSSEATFSLQEFAGSYSVSWKLLQDARSDKYALETVATLMDQGMKDKIFKHVNADVIDDGRGRLFVLPAADDQATITVSSFPSCVIGDVVDVMDTDNDTVHEDSASVTAVTIGTDGTYTVTLSAAPDTTGAGDYGVLQDTCDDSQNDSLHMNGLLGIIDDANPAAVVGNYGAINRSTAGNEFWESAVLSNSGSNRALTEDLLLQAFQYARLKGGGQTKAIISNENLIRRYHEMLKGDLIYSFGKVEPLSGGSGRKGDAEKRDDTGSTPYQFSGVPWHVDPHFQANTIVGIDTNHLWIGHGENATPMPVNEIFEGVEKYRRGTTAAFNVDFYWQADLLSDNPAAHWKIEDVAEA